ncbi:hypothetical protein K432DRAFT_442030 [Lepidopterella palustris CBS 459.81]|uniref:Uncharacterized protein n=1 Tax=Lepidopterella palustris CBS 459.81 TaxID=1314670 RepID=A0A8E2ED50_9PEZI|nr:hypothetical protein K432DRAFT_442030 [Lepidopterella palustris CBS 459.81]
MGRCLSCRTAYPNSECFKKGRRLQLSNFNTSCIPGPALPQPPLPPALKPHPKHRATPTTFSATMSSFFSSAEKLAENFASEEQQGNNSNSDSNSYNSNSNSNSDDSSNSYSGDNDQEQANFRSGGGRGGEQQEPLQSKQEDDSNNQQQGGMGGGQQKQGGLMGGLEQTAETGFINQTIDQFATKEGVPAEFDGVINQVVDQAASRYI